MFNSLLSLMNKIFDILADNKLVDHLNHFLIYKISGGLVRLQIFWQLQLMELLGLLTYLKLKKWKHKKKFLSKFAD